MGFEVSQFEIDCDENPGDLRKSNCRNFIDIDLQLEVFMSSGDTPVSARSGTFGLRSTKLVMRIHYSSQNLRWHVFILPVKCSAAVVFLVMALFQPY